MSAILFETELYTIGSRTILHLPDSASTQLPSRGQAMAKATINGVTFTTPLEPDGKWSHWFEVATAVLHNAKIASGDTVQVSIEPTKDWPEPKVPTDIKKALMAHKEAHDLFKKVTPMARWEWVRWIGSTANPTTRQHRIDVACSKLEKGMRRPCCWNRNLCTDPTVSKNGILLAPLPAPAV